MNRGGGVRERSEDGTYASDGTYGTSSGLEQGEQVVEVDGYDGGYCIVEAVGQDEPAAVNQCAAGVDDIRHITLPVALRGQQRPAQVADDLRRILEVEEHARRCSICASDPRRA